MCILCKQNLDNINKHWWTQTFNCGDFAPRVCFLSVTSCSGLNPRRENSSSHWITSLWRLCIIGIKHRPPVSHCHNHFLWTLHTSATALWPSSFRNTETTGARSKLLQHRSVHSRVHHKWVHFTKASNCVHVLYTHTQHAVHSLRGP